MLSDRPFVCPPWLLARAASLPALATAIVNAGNPLALESARAATSHGLVVPVFVGDASAIRTAAAEIEWDISGFEIVAAPDEVAAARQAVALARNGEVRALMKGHVHTDVLMQAVLHRSTGIRQRRRPSHVFCMTLPDVERPLFITDAVINVAPRVRQAIDIARNATDLLHALGNAEPRIAVLSAAETVRPELPSSVLANAVADAARDGAIPGAIVDGPLSFDIAVSPRAAAVKQVGGPVAGQADVLLVPNIDAGNFLFKQMVYFMGATAAGLVIGTRVPVTLTSRADPPEARLASAALASICADAQGEDIE